jgi:predicted transcriptional regulator
MSATTEMKLSPKDDVRRLLETLPESATWDEIDDAVYALARIRRGQEDAAAGRTVSHEAARERMQRWLAE